MTSTTHDTDIYDVIETLTQEVRDAARVLSASEARFLVDSYYAMQENRTRAASQTAALADLDEGAPVLVSWLAGNMHTLERNIAKLLQAYAEGDTVGSWALGITGIGPVLSAGLLAHIDITQAPTVGHIWRFAGLDPTVEWKAKQKRPWNADLKVLCWKIGESFVKVSGQEADIYGKVYLERKVLEVERNDAGLFADQAKAKLDRFNIGKTTVAYASYSVGKLPPAHLHARAKRYAVKLFLAHWHHVAYEVAFGIAPPKPYIIEHGGHTHYIAPPNWPTA